MAGSTDAVRFGFEQGDSLVQRAVESFLFALEDLFDVGLLRAQLGKDIAHGLRKNAGKFVEKRLMESERATVAHGAAQDAAQDVIAVAVARRDAVGHGKAQGSRMVGNDAESDVDFLLLAVSGRSGLGERRPVFLAAQLFNLGEERTENVGLVVGDAGVGKLGETFCPLHHGTDTFEAHAGVDVTGGQRRERAVRIGVELDKYEIPDLDALSRAFVDQCSLCVALRGQVDMQFRARTARTRVAHHPEVILLVAGHDVHLRIESGSPKMHRPVIPRLLIKLARITRSRRINGGIETRSGKFPPINEQLPSPVDGFFFEVIAEAPIPEHLEERVVVGIEPDIFEVVVLSSGTDAFLRIGRARVRSRDGARKARDIGLRIAEKNRDELVHPRVGEEQVRRVGHQARRRHDGVLLPAEKIEEALTDFVTGRNVRHNGPPNLTPAAPRTSTP